MAINVASNFNLKSKLPNFTRDQFKTLEEMRTFPEHGIDEGHISYCLEDKQLYVFKSENEADGTLGRWRTLSESAGGSTAAGWTFVTEDTGNVEPEVELPYPILVEADINKLLKPGKYIIHHDFDANTVIDSYPEAFKTYTNIVYSVLDSNVVETTNKTTNNVKYVGEQKLSTYGVGGYTEYIRFIDAEIKGDGTARFNSLGWTKLTPDTAELNISRNVLSTELADQFPDSTNKLVTDDMNSLVGNSVNSVTAKLDGTNPMANFPNVKRYEEDNGVVVGTLITHETYDRYKNNQNKSEVIISGKQVYYEQRRDVVTKQSKLVIHTRDFAGSGVVGSLTYNFEDWVSTDPLETENKSIRTYVHTDDKIKYDTAIATNDFNNMLEEGSSQVLFDFVDGRTLDNPPVIFDKNIYGTLEVIGGRTQYKDPDNQGKFIKEVNYTQTLIITDSKETTNKPGLYNLNTKGIYVRSIKGVERFGVTSEGNIAYSYGEWIEIATDDKVNSLSSKVVKLTNNNGTATEKQYVGGEYGYNSVTNERWFKSTVTGEESVIAGGDFTISKPGTYIIDFDFNNITYDVTKHYGGLLTPEVASLVEEVSNSIHNLKFKGKLVVDYNFVKDGDDLDNVPFNSRDNFFRRYTYYVYDRHDWDNYNNYDVIGIYTAQDMWDNEISQWAKYNHWTEVYNRDKCNETMHTMSGSKKMLIYIGTGVSIVKIDRNTLLHKYPQHISGADFNISHSGEYIVNFENVPFDKTIFLANEMTNEIYTNDVNETVKRFKGVLKVVAGDPDDNYNNKIYQTYYNYNKVDNTDTSNPKYNDVVWVREGKWDTTTNDYVYGQWRQLSNSSLIEDINSKLEKKADLVDGKIPSSQLPSYVDDVIEADNFAALPAEGEAGKIYVTLDDGKTFRWGGTEYVEISSSLAIGETEGTAYDGSKGKANADAITEIQNTVAFKDPNTNKLKPEDLPTSVFSGKFVTTNPVSNSVGGFNIGDEVSEADGMSIVEAINKMLYKYNPPKLSITQPSGNYIFEMGDTSIPELTVKGTTELPANLSKFSISSTSTIQVTENISPGETVPSPHTATEANDIIAHVDFLKSGFTLKYLPNLTSPANFTISVCDKIKPDVPVTRTVNIIPVYRIMCGAIGATGEVTDTELMAMESVLQTNNSFTYDNINLDNQRVVIAIPAANGAIKSIKDINNFELLPSFTKTTRNVVNSVTNTTSSYDIYTLDSPVTVTNFLLIIS